MSTTVAIFLLLNVAIGMKLAGDGLSIFGAPFALASGVFFFVAGYILGTLLLMAEGYRDPG